MAAGVRVPGLRPGQDLAAGRRPHHVRRLRPPDVSDRWHDLRPDPDAADGVVHRVLAVRHGQGRDLGAEPAAGSGYRLLSDGVGDAGPLRSVLVRPGRDRLAGRVEVDETYIGGEEPGLRGGRARGKKVLTGIAVEVRQPRGIGRCRLALLADGSSASLHPFITGHIAPGATVITDAWMGYHGLAGLGYVHQRRSQRAARARGDDPGELLPAVHRVASLAKRWLLSTHQGSVEEAHLQSYLDEFVFRFNRRRSRSRGLVFYRLLELAAGHDPVRYRNIVAGKRPRKIPPTPPAAHGHPPSLERPSAERPWRSADLDYSG
jgi:transposase-like protein